MEETVKDARQLMSECAAVVPEDECLKLIFGADYFWNKWEIKINWGLNKLWLWIFEDCERNLQDIGAPEKSYKRESLLTNGKISNVEQLHWSLF